MKNVVIIDKIVTQPISVATQIQTSKFIHFGEFDLLFLRTKKNYLSVKSKGYRFESQSKMMPN